MGEKAAAKRAETVYREEVASTVTQIVNDFIQKEGGNRLTPYNGTGLMNTVVAGINGVAAVPAPIPGAELEGDAPATKPTPNLKK